MNRLLLFFLFTLVFISVVSCRRKQPTCKSNCYDMRFNGRVYDKTSNAPFANKPISVLWYQKAYCIGCSSFDVVSGFTKTDGTFDLAATIDTTFFKDYYLSVRLQNDSNYISLNPDGSSYHLTERLYNFNATGLQNLVFEFYPKTSLTLRLHRTQNDVWDYFSVEHSFWPQGGYVDCTITGQQRAKDSTLTVPTSANVSTKISWVKKTAGQVTQRNTDSIVCTKAGLNVYDVYY